MSYRYGITCASNFALDILEAQYMFTKQYAFLHLYLKKSIFINIMNRHLNVFFLVVFRCFAIDLYTNE